MLLILAGFSVAPVATAQTALVVASCGSATRVAGTFDYPTIDVNGVACGGADGDPVRIVATCGTVSPVYVAGRFNYPTADTTGVTCVSGGGGGGGTPGGSTNQIQYNAGSGNFGGFTLSGDATAVVATGVITVTKTNGVSFGTAATVNTGTSGATIPLLNGTNTWANPQTLSSALTYGGVTLSNAVTGTGAMALATSPTLVTPTLGVATATTVNGVTIPSATDTTALLGTAQTFTAVNQFNSGDLKLKGATSGTITLNAAGTAGTSTITLPGGTTDFSATGGTSQVVQQATTGAAFTVGRLACADLSNAGAGCSGAAAPSAANPTGTVGTSAVNGSAATFMRSDGAPAINLTMSPTWTGTHTFAAGTITTSAPTTFSQTWNAAGVTFKGIVENYTLTANASASVLHDIQVAGTSAVAFGISDGDGNRANVSFANASMAVGVDANGSTNLMYFGSITTPSAAVTNGSFTGGGGVSVVGNSGQFGFTSGNVFQARDTILTRKAAANWQIGAADAAAPVAQTLSVQSIVAGTTNTAGALWKFSDSIGTGTGASGGYEFDVHPLGGSGTSQNAASSAMTLSGAGLFALPLISTDATHTDATVCEDTTTHAFYAGSGTLGVCLGTSSARYKHGIAQLNVGLDAIMRLRPVSYYLNADHGDPSHQLYGFTAEDMRPVIPALVGMDAHGQPNTADYVGLIPVLVRAVQEQQAEIADLRAQVAQLQGSIQFTLQPGPTPAGPYRPRVEAINLTVH